MSTGRHRTLDNLSAGQLRRLLSRTERAMGIDSDTATRLRRLVAVAEAREMRQEARRRSSA